MNIEHLASKKIGTPIKNSKEGGVVEFTIFQENAMYVGVCLTFDIVVEGEHYDEVRQELMDAATLHIETVRKNNLPEELLNRHAPQEYWIKRDAELMNGGNETRSFDTLLSPYSLQAKEIA